jgi:hypothetical protein
MGIFNFRREATLKILSPGLNGMKWSEWPEGEAGIILKEKLKINSGYPQVIYSFFGWKIVPIVKIKLLQIKKIVPIFSDQELLHKIK